MCLIGGQTYTHVVQVVMALRYYYSIFGAGWLRLLVTIEVKDDHQKNLPLAPATLIVRLLRISIDK